MDIFCIYQKYLCFTEKWVCGKLKFKKYIDTSNY